MKARHRIAVAHGVVAAALGPADDREDAVAHRAQPVALLAAREGDIGLRPALRPVILGAVETGGAAPVLPGEVVAVPDAEPALLRRIDQEQPAERPERLAAEALPAFLLDHDDALAGVGEFRRRNQPGEPRADHDHVRLFRHGASRFCLSARLKRAAQSAVNIA